MDVLRNYGNKLDSQLFVVDGKSATTNEEKVKALLNVFAPFVASVSYE